MLDFKLLLGAFLGNKKANIYVCIYIFASLGHCVFTRLSPATFKKRRMGLQRVIFVKKLRTNYWRNFYPQNWFWEQNRDGWYT